MHLSKILCLANKVQNLVIEVYQKAGEVIELVYFAQYSEN